MSPDIEAAIRRREELLGPCKLWEGALNNNGYGPSRRAYEKEYGPVPPGYDVAHMCHARACIEPRHLTIKTRAENMAMSRHREKKPHLTPREVRAVRALLATGNFTQLEVAQTLDLHGSTIAKIHTRRTYADV